MEPQELIDRYKEGERDFAGVDLSGITIKGHDLSDINLEGSDLRNCKFTSMTFNNANLKNCNFCESQFEVVSFINADLKEAKLTKSWFKAVNFQGAELTNAKFRESHRLIDCNFENAKMNKVDFYKVGISHQNFSSLDLQECNFSQVSANYINFNSSNLTRCNFKMANLESSNFQDACLKEANFKQANLKNANIMRSKLKSVSFVGANLTDANLYASNYEEAKIIGAIMPDGEVYDPEGYFVFESTPKSTQVEFIDTENAPKSPNSPHQAVIVNGSLYVAGQIAIAPTVNAILCEDEITEQTRQVMDNLTAILTAAGAGWTDVVKTTIFMIDLNECDRMNSVYSQYFPEGNLPICTCVAVSQLPQNVRIQIECVATV
ncbi:Rid family detoxifying hydrolase [Lyngbya sp. CCY1209]|jgi:2-iminobutanoate/2-iminopropanoate deaminase|uniref:Rid family detoxifying hydrolase n=1 Tax=Lyngbya sp. CCY1209 TaxID=2886103 RepID=UPI002D20566C|nr:Rid family detoxifying hydrolase [Lyngbya sp. CCY1209]MEB3887183.1 Rid family detoxifying hydrolase [Lyngbya sp. CCY1209]